MEELKKTLYTGLEKLEKTTDKFPIEDRETYAMWLAQTYYFVCHSTRLLAHGSALFDYDHNDYHYRFAEHIKEEKGHELLAVNDLKKLGFNVKNLPELSSTQMFYQTQYYWIKNVNPLSLFGYILCLETFSIGGGLRLFEKVCKTHGPETASFLRVHTREDVGHVDEAFKHVKGLSKDELTIIEKNMSLSFEMYENTYKQIIEYKESQPRGFKKSA